MQIPGAVNPQNASDAPLALRGGCHLLLPGGAWYANPWGGTTYQRYSQSFDAVASTNAAAVLVATIADAETPVDVPRWTRRAVGSG